MGETINCVGVAAECGDWREVDRTLRGLAQQRAALDAEEAKWLRVADRLQIWRRVGCVSLLEYMERWPWRKIARRAGYRGGLRVGQAAGDRGIPRNRRAAVHRDPRSPGWPHQTESQWLDAGRDKNVHQIEALVSGHRQGDLSDRCSRSHDRDEGPALRSAARDVRPDAPGEGSAREAKASASTRTLIAALCTSVLERAPMRARTVDASQARAHVDLGLANIVERCERDAGSTANVAALVDAASETESRDIARAKFQIAIVLCRECKRGWQDGGGKYDAPIDAAGYRSRHVRRATHR